MSLVDAISTVSLGMSAETVRLNTVASNLSNINVTARTEKAAYHAKAPVFKSIMINEANQSEGVGIKEIVTDTTPAKKMYEPGNPQADENGYVYGSNVDRVSALTNMISASQSYQADVSVANTCKELLLDTISTFKG